MIHKLFFDGSEKAYGFLLDGEAHTYLHDEEVTTIESESLALLAGLKRASELQLQELEIIGDSQVVLNQVLGVAKARGSTQRRINSEIRAYLDLIPHFRINWVPRHLNKADDISRPPD